MYTLFLYYAFNAVTLLDTSNAYPIRIHALKNLNVVVDVNTDKNIQKYYVDILTKEPIPSEIVVQSFSESVKVPERAMLFIIDRCKYDVIEAIRLMYVCRRQWWGNKFVQDHMTKRINECYPVPNQKSTLQLSERELNNIFRSIQCYGYAGRKSYTLPLLMLMGDKRVVVNHNRFPGIGYAKPEPSRICDAVLFSLMLMYEVDMVAVGQYYDYPFSAIKAKRPFQDRVVEAYDRMIDDFGSLNDRFFK